MEVGPAGVLAPDGLRQWLADRGEPCGDARAALAAVERRLPEALADPELGPMVENEAALLLGAVLVTAVDGARWIVWPNGHPVVRIGHTELDVSAIAHDYVCRQGEPLTAVVDRYRR
ncbi:DUF6278 family protein [Tomitella fengzijianii]|uniref:Uncharacterized protein n=1 Tax=Tomitella fengzijianii TaxID=2597660 RepID=A0A516X6K6_9ACTN|nr:DUF6278 family protein [Tomitella fengzijianii]QDQ98708.1 hypothetical protein FO059_16945 [Tomitella fengzijianii]